MKKLKLQALQFGAKEILTRAQLKNVMGGDDGSTGSTSNPVSCTGTCVIGENNSSSCSSKLLYDVPYCYCEAAEAKSTCAVAA